MNKFVIHFVLLFLACESQGQRSLPEIRAMKERHIRCDTVPQLADSIFSAIKTRVFDSIEVYTPSYWAIKAAFDTLDFEREERFVMVKQQYIVYNLWKQNKILQKKAKLHRINLKYIELEKTNIRYGFHKEGYPFAMVSMNCSKNSNKFVISFVAIKVLNHWYIADELTLKFPDEIPSFMK
jgi:hypothetical protein